MVGLKGESWSLRQQIMVLVVYWVFLHISGIFVFFRLFENLRKPFKSVAKTF